jgi:hypothetical protein
LAEDLILCVINVRYRRYKYGSFTLSCLISAPEKRFNSSGHAKISLCDDNMESRRVVPDLPQPPM